MTKEKDTLHIKIFNLKGAYEFERIEDKLRNFLENEGLSAQIDDEVTENTTRTRDKQTRAEDEFNDLLENEEIQERTDGDGNFCGYDDEAGHVYMTKEDVINALGLGELDNEKR